MMYTRADYKNLVNKIQNEIRIRPKDEDRFDRMFHLTSTRLKQLRSFGKSTIRSCASYERKHHKSGQMANYYVDKANGAINSTVPSEMDSTVRRDTCFAEAINAWHNALLYQPQNLTSWTHMLQMLDIYVNRAKAYFEQRYFNEAYSDLKHASSILNNEATKEQCREHFLADPDLLATILAIKILLLEHVNKKQFSIKSLLTSLNITEIVGSVGDLTEGGEGDERELSKGTVLSLLKIDDVKRKFEQIEDRSVWYNILQELDQFFQEHEQEKCELHGKAEGNFTINPKLKLQSSESGGRCYSTGSHILKGELVLQERPLSLIVFNDFLFDYCSYCYRSMSTFWPCPQCIEISFCSLECAQRAYNEFHRYECGIYGLILGKENFYSMAHVFRHYATFGVNTATRSENELVQLEQEKQLSNLDIEKDYIEKECFRLNSFDKLSDEEKKTICTAITSLLHHRAKRDPIRESTHTVLSFGMIYLFIYKGLLSKEIVADVEQFSKVAEHIATAMLRTCTNGFCWAEERTKTTTSNDGQPAKQSKDIVKIASCICFVSSFFNHSCDPNVTWSINELGISLTALRTIAPGEQLTICYGPKRWNEFEQRQQRLRDDYCFYCQCTVCRKDAANSTNDVMVIKCQSETGCDGPLVFNRYQACLSCGAGATENAKLLTILMGQSSKKFTDVLKTLTLNNSDKNDKKLVNLRAVRSTLMSCVGLKKKPPQYKLFLNNNHSMMENRSQQGGKAIKQKLLDNNKSKDKGDSEVININLMYSNLIQNQFKIENSLSDRKIEKLEKHFFNYCEIAYGRSYKLLEMVCFLLYVYNRTNKDVRALRLLDQVNQCLDDLYPELIENELIHLVYKLEYLSKYFENLAQIKFPSNGVNIGSKNSPDSIQMKTKFWSLVQRINYKLLDILRYDMNHRGTIYPKLYQMMTCQSDTIQEYNRQGNPFLPRGSGGSIFRKSKQLTSNHSSKSRRQQQRQQHVITGDGNATDVDDYGILNDGRLSHSERYFKKMYDDCQRRLQITDQALNPIFG